MTELKIERIGGLAGFGLGKSRIRSRGSCALEDLSAPDRAAVEKLFATRGKTRAPHHPDAFRYRITRTTSSGTETIEIPESIVPPYLASVVRDEID